MHLTPADLAKGNDRMPGFRDCSWCHGKGCMCCDAERQKWEKAEAVRLAKHAMRTPDEIRQSLVDLRWIRNGGRQDGVSLGTVMAVGINGRDGFDMAKIDAEIAKEEVLLDAEYARQFPNGPQPIFTAKAGSPSDMQLLKHVAHADVLTAAFGPNGGGMAEIQKRATEARLAQALRDYAYGEGAGI